jgi:hypothetical protein
VIQFHRDEHPPNEHRQSRRLRTLSLYASHVQSRRLARGRAERKG